MVIDWIRTVKEKEEVLGRLLVISQNRLGYAVITTNPLVCRA